MPRPSCMVRDRLGISNKIVGALPPTQPLTDNKPWKIYREKITFILYMESAHTQNGPDDLRIILRQIGMLKADLATTDAFLYKSSYSLDHICEIYLI